MKKGIDPLKENLDGSLRKVPLGFEEAECGPTSNFVGNHMTQGAIDLVQAELKMNQTQYQQMGYNPPKLIAVASGDVEGNLMLKQGNANMNTGNANMNQGKDDDGKEYLAQHKNRKSTSELFNENNDHMVKYLREIEWRQDDTQVMILLERPFEEDVTTRMHISSSFTPSSINIAYRISPKRYTNKNESKEKTYRYHLQTFSRILAEQSSCHMGGGTLEEIAASADIAGKEVEVSHSDTSTLIYIVLQKAEKGTVWKDLRAEGEKQDAMMAGGVEQCAIVQPAQPGDLTALKSLIRRTRNRS